MGLVGGSQPSRRRPDALNATDATSDKHHQDREQQQEVAIQLKQSCEKIIDILIQIEDDLKKEEG